MWIGSRFIPSTMAEAARGGIRLASPSSCSTSMCHQGESHFGQ